MNKLNVFAGFFQKSFEGFENLRYSKLYLRNWIENENSSLKNTLKF